MSIVCRKKRIYGHYDHLCILRYCYSRDIVSSNGKSNSLLILYANKKKSVCMGEVNGGKKREKLIFLDY